MNPPSPRSRTASAEEIHVPFHFMGPLYSQQSDNYQMTSPPNTYASEAEVQPRNTYSSDFHSNDTSVLPVETYIDAVENIYISPALTSASYYDTTPPSNTWASETPAGLDSHVAEAVYSPPILAHCISIPSTISSDGLEPIYSHAWQFDSGPLMQTDLGILWWCDPWPGTGTQTTVPSRVLKTADSITHRKKPNRTSVSDTKADGSEHEFRTDSAYPSPPRKKKKSDGSGSYQETSVNSNAPARPIDVPYSCDSAATPVPPNPDVSFDSADAEAQTNPRRSRSPGTAGSRSDKPRERQSPTPVASRPEQRARNRIAANKCRTKTKAAVAELEAKAKQESLRHEQLSMTVRGLQAEVFALKSEILMHGACGDSLIQDYLNGSARSLAAGCGGVAEWGPGRVSHIPISGSMQLKS